MKPLDNIRNVILRNERALVVQTKPIRLHVVEPDLVRTAVPGFGKDQHSGGYARIGLEHAAGHGDDCLQPVVFNELHANGLVRRGRAEEHAVRHDAGAAPAHLQHLQEQRKEQQLGLFRLAELEQIGAHDVVIQRALERRICQNEGIHVAVRILVGEAVAVLDEGVVHAVGHHVHRADAQHGAVHVVAVEHVVHVVFLVGAVEEDLLLAVLLQVFARRDEEAGGSAGRIYVPADFDTIEKAFSGG